MATDVTERLANYRSVLDDAIESDIATRQPTGRPPDRRQRALVAASAVVIVAVGIGALAWTRSDQPISPSNSLLIDQPVITDPDAAPLITDLPDTTEAPESSRTAAPPAATLIDRLAIGDQIMLGAAGLLAERGFVVDAVESRQFNDGADLIQTLSDHERLGDLVVIQLGTNGPIGESTMTQMMEALANVPHVLLLTIDVPREWTDGNNALIYSTAAEYPNVELLDWAGLADSCPGDCFANDGYHLRADGQAYYTRLIDAATTDKYIVQTGDYPILVAQKFCTTISELVAVNGWTTANDLPAPGFEISVPTPVDDASCPDPAT